MQVKKNNAKHCISSIPQELHIIKMKFCISSSRQKCTPKGVMIYTLKRNDIPSLSAWIKKIQVRRLGIFWRRHPDLNRGIRVLQTRALPLGYGAVLVQNDAGAPSCIFWSGIRGSNSLPPPWQGGALPDELIPQMVPPVRVEPTTHGFSVRCSTN